MEEGRRGMINHSMINLCLLITVASKLGQARFGLSWGRGAKAWENSGQGGTGSMQRRKVASRVNMVTGTKEICETFCNIVK